MGRLRPELARRPPRAHRTRSAPAGHQHELLAVRRQASVGAGFNDIARSAGLATRKRKAEPRDITRYVARQVLHETGQLSEGARRLGLSSLDAAAGLAGLAWQNGEASP